MSTHDRDISKNAVVYARYSSHAQTDQSIEGQLAAAKKYAKDHGYTIVHEYIDRAMTGRNDNRAAFQQMLSDTAKKQFSIIIVWKTDRFGRNREELTFNKYKCKKNGVHIEYVAENMPQGPEAVILESLFEGMAEYYSLQLSQNVKRGRLNAATKHQAVGGVCPLGYKVNKETKKYEINPDTAPTVKLIFEKYASGCSLFDLMRYLNEKGYQTEFKKPFTKNSLPRILSNPRYYGVYTYHDSENDIFDEGGMPAIIDKELFDKVQEKLQVNKRRPVSTWTREEYLLTGKIFCGKCGAPMVGVSGFGKSGKKFCYYGCQNHLHKKCDAHNVRKNYVEDVVLDEVHKLLADPELLNQIADIVYKLYLEEHDNSQELNRLNEQLKDIDARMQRLIDAIERGIAVEAITPRIEALNAERDKLNLLIADTELQPILKLTKDHILFFLEQFRDNKVGDIKCDVRLIETFVNSVFVTDKEIKIVFNVSNDPGGPGGKRAVTLKELDNSVPVKCSHPVCNASLRGVHTNTLQSPIILKDYAAFAITYIR